MNRPEQTACGRSRGRRRRGAAALDYVLVLAVALPLVAFMVSRGIRIIQLVYEMICLFISWPFM